MAIDTRQEQLQRPAERGTGAPRAPKRGAWAMVLAVAAVIAVVGTLAVVVLQEDSAPTSGMALTYPEGASTAEREGGEYLVVTGPVAGYADTLVGVREGGGFAAVPGSVADGAVDLGVMQQKAAMAAAGITSIGGSPDAG
jgi:hypothetical protein